MTNINPLVSNGVRLMQRISMAPMIARHHLRTIIPKNKSVLGFSLMDKPTTIKDYLLQVDSNVYMLRSPERATITSSGVVRVGHQYLSLDYGPYSAFRLSNIDLPFRSRHLNSVLPLWSHPWTSYYHWLIDIAPKIAEAKRYLGAAFSDLMFLYPGQLRKYEQQTVEALGVSATRLVNLREVGSVTADNIYVLPLPGYVEIHPGVDSLRMQLGVTARPMRRIYMSRQAHVRKVENEDALFNLLEKYGFEFIPDVPRSIADQVKLYSEASHIVAPHGAGLSNIIWCSSSTSILELANSQYHPDFFQKLAGRYEMPYRKLVFGTGKDNWSSLAVNYSVDLNMVKRFLSE